MKIINSTDGKYLGLDVPELKVGETLALGDFVFEVDFIHAMADGTVCLGNENYQLILEVN